MDGLLDGISLDLEDQRRGGERGAVGLAVDGSVGREGSLGGDYPRVYRDGPRVPRLISPREQRYSQRRSRQKCALAGHGARKTRKCDRTFPDSGENSAPVLSGYRYRVNSFP